MLISKDTSIPLSRRFRLPGVVAALAVIVAGAGGFFLLRRRPKAS